MKKGELWLVELPNSEGREQYGKRPAIVMNSSISDVVIVLPLTSNIQALRFPFVLQIEPSKQNGLSALSIALVFHIRAIDKKRLTEKIGKLEPNKLEDIDLMIKKLFKLA